jgi:dissimilatory sulfite reductase (desulfoviridin) alpha/beta subunit
MGKLYKMENIKEQIRSIVRENFIKEMHKNDIHFIAIMKYYDKGTPSTKKQVAIVVTGKKTSNRGQIMNDLMDMDYHEILDVEKKLKYVKEYFDKKGNERVAAALPQTEEEPQNEI